VGFTIGAWAVSYPALWSSIILARKGFGQIALYNAIGSNTFSNLLGLGIPWFVYSTSTSTRGFQEQGLAFSNIALLLMTIAIYLLIACNSFTLSRR
jgi:Ca2+/Na+ antiporter